MDKVDGMFVQAGSTATLRAEIKEALLHGGYLTKKARGKRCAVESLEIVVVRVRWVRLFGNMQGLRLAST